MINGKLTKPSASGDGQVKNWTNREGLREANKGKTSRGGEGCEAADDKHGGHNVLTLRTSAAEDL